MSHVRTQIREAVKRLLEPIAPVSVSRVFAIAEAELPVILVTTNSEDIGGGLLNAYQRQLELVVDCVAKGPEYDVALDEMAAAVESVLNRSTLGGLCAPLLPERFDVLAEPGAVAIGRLRMTYSAVYYTEFTEPEVAV